jgi:hypothetical protein
MDASAGTDVANPENEMTAESHDLAQVARFLEADLHECSWAIPDTSFAEGPDPSTNPAAPITFPQSQINSEGLQPLQQDLSTLDSSFVDWDHLPIPVSQAVNNSWDVVEESLVGISVHDAEGQQPGVTTDGDDVLMEGQ